MTSPQDKAARFLSLHHGDHPLLLANAWDQGSARLLAALGFQALATTSSGHAATFGRLDGSVTLDEAITHAALIVDATDLPVNADFENGFADAPDAVAANVARLATTGVAGFSVEDFTRDEGDPIYPRELAAARVAAAAEVAHAGAVRQVLTARAENFLHGRADLDDTIARLEAYQTAGADVLYAPGVTAPADIRRLVESVERPVNVLALPGVPSVAELAAIGVARVSVGGAFNAVALGALATAGRELLESGTYGYFAGAATGRAAMRTAFA